MKIMHKKTDLIFKLLFLLLCKEFLASHTSSTNIFLSRKVISSI